MSGTRRKGNPSRPARQDRRSASGTVVECDTIVYIAPMLFRFGEVEIEPSTYRATRGGEPLSLQPKMFELLCYLIEHRERVVSREELLQAFWANEEVGDTVVTWTVSHIRKQIGPGPGGSGSIATVHGRGYRFTADVDHLELPDQHRPGTERVRTPASMPFVGRDVVMRRLEDLLSATLEGHGCLCLLTGEAGIGKTRCARALLARASELGASTISAHAVEGAGAPPFWPLLHTLRQLSDSSESLRERAQALHVSLSTVAGGGDDAVEGDATDRRFWLYDSLTKLLIEHTHERPLVLFIDDLHWADEGTLDALRFLAMEASNARLMVLATERRELSGSRLRGHLARHTTPVELARLTPADIKHYLQGLVHGAAAVPDKLVAAIHRATAGNPLFVEETLRGLLAIHDPAALVEVDTETIQPPTVARDVLLTRMEQLPGATRELLKQASVLGEEFDLSLLEAITNRPMDELIGDLQTASDGAFIVAQSPNTYRFAHALHREVLYDSMTSQARVETHRRAACALEERDGLDQHRADVARHYYRSLPAGDFKAVVRAAKRAAKAAAAVASHGDAARFYSWALEAQALEEDLSPLDRANLLCTTGVSLRNSGRDREARETLSSMFELARQHDFLDLLLLGSITLRPNHILGMVADPLVRDALEHVLRSTPKEPNRLRIEASSLLASIPPYSLDMDRSKRICADALADARKLGERVPLLAALRASFYAMAGPDDVDALHILIDEALDDPQGLPSHVALDAITARIGACLHRGDVESAERATDALGRLAEDRKLVDANWYYRRLQAQRAFREGHFDVAEQGCDVLQSQSDRIGHSYGDILINAVRHSIEMERTGREVWTERERYTRLSVGGAFIVMDFRTRLTRAAAEAGLTDMARASLSALASGDFETIPRGLSYLCNLSNLALTSLALPEQPHAELLYRLLEPYADFNTPDFMFRYEGSVSRYLALLAAALGRHDQVEHHFEHAVASNRTLRHIPILVRTQLEFATWLLQRGGAGMRERARALLDEAANTAGRAHMDWLVERARGLR